MRATRPSLKTKLPVAAPEHGIELPRIDADGYEKVRRKPGAVEIFMSTALRPQNPLDSKALQAILDRKSQGAGKKKTPQHVIVHLREKRANQLEGKLRAALQGLSQVLGKWYIKVDPDPDRSAAETRVRASVPKGLVASDDINAALAGLSSGSVKY